MSGLEDLIVRKLKGEDKFYAISGLTLEPVRLKKKLVKGGSYDSDGDGLSDSEEVNWDFVKNVKPLELYTLEEFLGQSGKPYIRQAFDRFLVRQRSAMAGISMLPELSKVTSPDTDQDGIPDKEDWYPEKPDLKNAEIFRSKKSKITDAEGKTAGDLTFSDLSKKQILEVREACEKELGKSASMLKKRFKSQITSLAMGKLDDVGRDMVDKFMEGKGNDYENKELTKAFKNHKNTKRFTKDAKQAFLEKLKENNYDLAQMVYEKNNSYDRAVQKLIYPKFNNFTDNFMGMGILIHDIWACKISIKNYKATKQGYSGTMHFIYYDHFGLDEDDIKGDSSYGYDFGGMTGFRSWFVLQHYEKFKKKYKPFVTVCQYDVKFSGSYFEKADRK